MGYTSIYIQRNEYFYYDSYNTWNEAMKVAKKYTNGKKNQYFILKVREGIVFPMTKFKLYMTKVMRLI